MPGLRRTGPRFGRRRGLHRARRRRGAAAGTDHAAAVRRALEQGQAQIEGRTWVAALLSPILQPRFAMGMAFTILSLAMLAQLLVPGGLRQPTLSDLEPARIWAGLEQNVLSRLGRVR